MQGFGFTWMTLFYVVILLLAVGHQERWIASIFRSRWLQERGIVSYCADTIHARVAVAQAAPHFYRARRHGHRDRRIGNR